MYGMATPIAEKQATQILAPYGVCTSVCVAGQGEVQRTGGEGAFNWICASYMVQEEGVSFITRRAVTVLPSFDLFPF